MTKQKEITFKDLANEYLQQDKEQTIEVWDKVSYLSSSLEEKLLTSPKLVKLYIISDKMENKKYNLEITELQKGSILSGLDLLERCCVIIILPLKQMN